MNDDVVTSIETSAMTLAWIPDIIAGLVLVLQAPLGPCARVFDTSPKSLKWTALFDFVGESLYLVVLFCAEQMAFAHSETAEHVRATLGAILRRHREANEWSLADIARPAGISTAYLSEVERGHKDISTDRLLAVARALDVTVGDLFLEL